MFQYPHLPKIIRVCNVPRWVHDKRGPAKSLLSQIDFGATDDNEGSNLLLAHKRNLYFLKPLFLFALVYILFTSHLLYFF